MIREPLDQIDSDKFVVYDLETTHQYASYAKIKMAAVQYGLNSEPELIQMKGEWDRFRRAMSNPNVLKVDFNGVNFDRIVLARHEMPVHPKNAHDLFMIFKTISPNLPAFGLKFCSFYFFGDPHFPEMEVQAYMAEHDCDLYQCPKEMLARYNKHDITQTVNLLRLGWDIVIRPEHWDAYLLSLKMAEPLEEMCLEGGMFLDTDRTWWRLQRLQKRIQKLTNRAIKLTHGKVQNPNSSQQLGKYFTEVDKIELALTDSGEFCVKKSVLVSLMEDNKLAWIAFKIREANGSAKYFENYLSALADLTYQNERPDNWIPIQISVDAARTRRNTSQSLYKLNFQNPNEAAKEVQLVPTGFLGVWIDSTQVENVVHIYESRDSQRRAAYETNPDWNEYVWLCNQILGTDKSKDELDDKENSRSPQIPGWTIYKQFKTGKLALNFGMGIKKFCELFGLARSVGEEIFATIHRACPAIRELQNRVAHDLRDYGFVSDVFGKRYAGPSRMAYKVVAYLIQGCGTGSLPKAQIRANWETLRRFDKRMPERLRRQETKCGVITGTIHDENSSRIDLRLGDGNILQLLQKMMYNMTDRFSDKFDNIPLRAKLYLSRSYASEAEEVNINDHKKILAYASLH